MREYTEEQKKLLGALVGLARALDAAAHEEGAAAQELLSGLHAFFHASEEERSRQAELVRAAKNKIAPDCAVCMNPCGKTFDYDWNDFDALDSVLREKKLQLLDALGAYAARTACTKENAEAVSKRLTEALFFMGYDYLTEEQITEQIETLQESGAI